MKLYILCMPLRVCVLSCMTQCLQHLCASWRAAAARRCVWSASHRKPSCRRKASRRCAAGRELWAATFSWMSSHNRGRGRCASSSLPPQACREYTHTHTLRHMQMQREKMFLPLYWIFLIRHYPHTFCLHLYSWDKCKPCAASSLLVVRAAPESRSGLPGWPTGPALSPAGALRPALSAPLGAAGLTNTETDPL